jgi:hypothetical protein
VIPRPSADYFVVGRRQKELDQRQNRTVGGRFEARNRKSESQKGQLIFNIIFTVYLYVLMIFLHDLRMFK